MSALSAAALPIAWIASATDASREGGNGRFASAMREMVGAFKPCQILRLSYAQCNTACR